MAFEHISSRNDLADLLGIPHSKLTYILYGKKPESFYKTFEIAKKSGGTRKICAPTGNLKEIQRRIYDFLSEQQQYIRNRNNVHTNVSQAFEKGKSIMSNGKIHTDKRIVLNVDLENFFDSFHFGRVSGFFEKNQYFLFPHEMAVIIAQLTCYQGKLPQGAPTSPIITNMICNILDMRILRLAKKFHLDYTRYADDLTFSTNDKTFLEKSEEFQIKLSDEIEKAGFKINDNKTSIQYKDSRQIVTGLVVNKKPNVDSRYYKKVRAMANSLYKNGTYTNDGIKGTLGQLEGKFSFINQIDKYNNKRDKEQKHDVFHLNGRERQYQKFLFYKYFFANYKPLIVTEGESDIKYLKAALKNLHQEYPDLIEKTSSGNFLFKISFLNRTDRLKYFLGVSPGGADAMKNLYNFFSDNNPKFPNYYKILRRLSGKSPHNPVMLIFDNELNNNKKPLADFSSHAKLSDKQKKDLMDELSIKLFDNGNLYLLTNPLANGSDEAEIELLFDEAARGHLIEGKSLSLKENYDMSKNYGKTRFAAYVQENYKTIDFTGFKPILDNIVNNIKNY